MYVCVCGYCCCGGVILIDECALFTAVPSIVVGKKMAMDCWLVLSDVV
jgi:hypothetical protein